MQVVPVDEEGNLLKDQPIETWETDENPHNIQRIPVGTYALIEINAPKGYVKAEPIFFEVKDTDKIQSYTMIDKQVEVSKQDIVNGEELPGAELIIIDKETGKIVDQWISGDEPHFVSGLEEGKTYVLIENTAPEGFYIAESIEFTVTNDKVNQEVVMKDAPILTDIQISKTSSKTKELINETAQFALYADKDCTELVGYGKTLNGIVTFSQMRYGTYYLKELEAPTGYVLSNEVLKIVINDDTEGVGKIHKINFENTPVTRTGDETNISTYGALGLLALVGLAITRKKKETE